MATRFSLRRQRPKTFNEVGQWSVHGLQKIVRRKPRSAQASGIGCERSVDVARPAHPGALIAARPQNSRHDPRRHQCKDRFENNFLWHAWTMWSENASAAFLDTLDHSEKLTAHLYLQGSCPGSRRCVATNISIFTHDHSAPSTAGPTIVNIEQTEPTSQGDDDRERTTERTVALGTPVSAVSQNSAATLHCKPKGAWQQVGRNEDLCSLPLATSLINGSATWTLLQEVSYRRMTFVINVRKRRGNRSYTGNDGCRFCGTFLDFQVEHGETCSAPHATRGNYACVHAMLDIQTV